MLELGEELESALQLPVAASLSYEDIYLLVLRHIRFLLDKDFHQLILLLYRLDVSEEKLRSLLAEQTHVDAGQLITGLIMERIALKIKTRKSFTATAADPDDPERW